MKLSIFLALFISVGAWGQTTKPMWYVSHCGNGAVVSGEDEYEALYNAGCDVVPLDEAPTAKPKWWPNDKPFHRFHAVTKLDPVDVPAIQEPRTITLESNDWARQLQFGADCVDLHDGIARKTPTGAACDFKEWTCKDQTRSLHETVDGKTHYCHKPRL